MASTRIFYASDAHGSDRTFMKFVNAGKYYKADVLIMGGDITGKMVIPIVKQDDGTLECSFLGRTYAPRTAEDAANLQTLIADSGYYYCILSKEQMNEFGRDPNKVNELFSELMVERAKKWVETCEKRLEDTKIRCFILPGNDDQHAIDTIFDGVSRVINPEGKVILIDDQHEMISTGYANITPFGCPRDIPEEELAKRIEAMTSQVKDMRKCIFNFHCPPYGSGLDTAVKLDENLKPVTEGGNVLPTSCGSTAIHEAIKRHQPLLGLHGHIHESRGTAKIGRTLCLNAGSEYSEGILRGAIINLDDDKIKGFLLTSG